MPFLLGLLAHQDPKIGIAADRPWTESKAKSADVSMSEAGF